MATHADSTVPGQWVVLLKPYVSESRKSNHLESIRTMTADENTPFSCEAHLEFDLDECRGYSGKFDLQSKENIEKMDEVLSIEPVRRFRHCQRETQRNATWGLERISEPRKVKSSGPYSYKYHDDAAGQGTIAYIIDTGINSDHIEFEGRASRGPKFVTSDHPSDRPASDADIVGHGTHVAGTIGSRRYGVAKKVLMTSIKVFSDITGTARTDDIILAIQWAVRDAKAQDKNAVINLSLGGSHSPALNCAVSSAVRSGLVVCVAAGNESEPADKTSPASEPLAITVASMDKADKISHFSNYGRFVDTFAPGTEIISCWIGSNTATNTINGTSMATPHVTGLACCILSDETIEERTPYGVASQLGIKADKNKLLGLDSVTSNTIIQV